jgi:hypothetical protein
MDETEERWLDYAWRVVNCPPAHLRLCENAGGARSGPGRVDGLDLRWPGYLGRNYHESQGILCVGAVHLEVPLAELESNPEGFRSDQTQVEAVRTWLTEGRSSGTDEIFLERMRTAYEGVGGLPRWQRWRRHFRSLVCDHLGMDETKVAWTNLAKCKCAIHLGSTQRAAQANLVRLCQQEFPVRDLVEAIRPVAVLVSVLNAKANGPIVSTWRSASCDPLVFTWQGQSGHDRHNTDPNARKFRDWTPDAAAQIRARMASGRA